MARKGLTNHIDCILFLPPARLREYFHEKDEDEMEILFSCARAAKAGKEQSLKPASSVSSTSADGCGVGRSVDAIRQAALFPTDSKEWKPLKDGTHSHLLPSFNMGNFTNYFILLQGADNLPVQNHKAMNEHALLLFSDRLVQRMQVASTEAGVFLQAACLPEMRSSSPYTMRLKLDTCADIVYAECGCPAGRPPHASCKHLAAFCYALEEFVRLGYNADIVTCTEKLSQWNVPRKRAPQPAPFAKISFKKAKYNPDFFDRFS